MGATSSQDPRTGQFEYVMQRLKFQSASLSRGTLSRCCPLQGDERAVVNRQDGETREHEETATVRIVLDDNVSALQPWGIGAGESA